MKMKFKGVVNGTEYTNVQEYNKALQEAISSGQAVVASSTTNSVCESEPNNPCCDGACRSKKDPTPQDFDERYQILLSDHQLFPEVDLDEFTGNDETDKPLLEKLTRIFSRTNAEENVSIMKNEPKEVVDIYLQDLRQEISEVMTHIHNTNMTRADIDQRHTRVLDTISSLENRLRDERKRADNLCAQNKVCNCAIDTLSLMNKYYNHIAWRLTHNEEKPEDGTQGVQGRESILDGTSNSWNLSPEQIEAGRKLLQAIFG